MSFQQSYDIAVIGAGIIGAGDCHAALARVPALQDNRAGEGRRGGAAPDRAQQRRHPRRHLLRARLAEGEFLLDWRAGRCGSSATSAASSTRCAARSSSPSTMRKCQDYKTCSSVAPRTARKGLEMVGPERLAELEPYAAGVQAIFSPNTGIIDFKKVSQAYAIEFGENGGDLLLNTAVHGIARRDNRMYLEDVARRDCGAAHHQLRWAASRPGGAHDGRGPRGYESSRSAANTSRLSLNANTSCDH